MVDLERIKADPDPNPTFQADVDLNLNPKMLSDSEGKKISSKSSFVSSP